LDDLEVGGKIYYNRLGLSGPELEHMAGCCDCGNELSLFKCTGNSWL